VLGRLILGGCVGRYPVGRAPQSRIRASARRGAHQERICGMRRGRRQCAVELTSHDVGARLTRELLTTEAQITARWGREPGILVKERTVLSVERYVDERVPPPTLVLLAQRPEVRASLGRPARRLEVSPAEATRGLLGAQGAICSVGLTCLVELALPRGMGRSRPRIAASGQHETGQKQRSSHRP
jgi:hypothetical protein